MPDRSPSAFDQPLQFFQLFPHQCLIAPGLDIQSKQWLSVRTTQVEPPGPKRGAEAIGHVQIRFLRLIVLSHKSDGARDICNLVVDLT
ncbi:hypothetical protein D3C77_419080 [compost metagenome]